MEYPTLPKIIPLFTERKKVIKVFDNKCQKFCNRLVTAHGHVMFYNLLIFQEKRSFIWSWTESESWLISALAFKVSWSSTPSVVAPGPDSPLSWWSVFRWIMERSLSWNSPSTRLLRSPLLWWVWNKGYSSLDFHKSAPTFRYCWTFALRL